MFYNTTFAPAFERERRYKMMKQTFRKKSSLRDLHNSTSSTSIGEEIFRIDTVKEV